MAVLHIRRCPVWHRLASSMTAAVTTRMSSGHST
jgi:hypothetical protein